ncbi:MAG: hypothetical protein OEV22_17470 [Deltaproteobacteria bacterium]|jgi:hypothetical protein|nr:hypothetical protein [Deltaproteobacteria bacterium]
MPCVDNKDLIYNVKELPETFSVTVGDLLLIETDEGTNIMDFANFVIGLDNTTFGTTITQHSTDIAALSSDVETLSSKVDDDIATLSAASIGNTTKALITLSAQDTYGPRLLVGTNITSVEFENNKIRFNFTNNFTNTDYLVLPAAATANDSNEFVQFVESEKQTNYIDLSAINIDGASLATSATTLGFQIQTF